MSVMFDGIGSYVNQMQQASNSNNKAEQLSNSLKNVSNVPTEEELTEAVKSFETYFVEQVLKSMEETTKMGNDEDENSASRMKDYFMGTAYTKVAEELVNTAGANLTKDLVDQMKRNYGIE